MSGYNTKVYHRQGGAELVVGAGGKITVEAGGKITVEAGGAIEAEGGPVSPIADLSLSGTYDGDDTAIQTAVNGILAALRGAGIVPSA